METIEIHADEIKVETIEAQIIDNMKERKKAGAYPEAEVKMLLKPLDGHYSCTDEKMGSLFYLDSHWELLNDNHVVKSNIPVIGSILVAGRKILYGEVKRCTDPLFLKETEFNRHVANVLSDVNKKLERTAFPNKDVETEIKNYIDLKFDQIKQELLLQIKKEIENIYSDSKCVSENSNVLKPDK
jgi:hypothetical protein